ncbi:MAG: hypothetical protein ABI895_13140 [Deltaproteobacteria bacterium]
MDTVENVLMANCGSCHGPAAPVAASGGIRFIDDVAQLVEAGLLVPLSSASSRIIRVMVVGSMPPPSSGLPPVTDADISTIVQYIDNQRYWPDVSLPPVVDRGAESRPVDAGADGG